MMVRFGVEMGTAHSLTDTNRLLPSAAVRIGWCHHVLQELQLK